MAKKRIAKLRDAAVDNQTYADRMQLGSHVAYGIAGAAALTKFTPIASAGAAIGTYALAQSGSAAAKAAHGRMRAAGLDYLTSGGAKKTGDLVRAPVTVRRNGKVFSRLQMVRRES